MKLSGKVAVVTGGARGLGKAIAQRFLKEGAVVVITDINKEALQICAADLSGFGEISGIQMDVTKFDEVQERMAGIIRERGKIDVLVNNAGITADAQLKNMSEAQFDSVVAVNMKGVFCCTKGVVNHMISNGYGKIINISSVTAHNGNFGQTNYAATKAAVIAMTQTWAKELAKSGINVNAVAPGYIATEMVQKVPEKILDSIRAKTPSKRLGEPDEIAAACAYLASDESKFVNGAVLKIDGGLVL
ncbi:MAG: glucose 1-dehydrogenase [Clostridia bacterium]|jgi:3-oxoacyl-[acyl-carrier protein] reductase|nr:glucose 1-dehydrogenase [Clostridia bacterium]MBT7122136.1 glucose 1-dehydrogenase [Clostridia bacterium]